MKTHVSDAQKLERQASLPLYIYIYITPNYTEEQRQKKNTHTYIDIYMYIYEVALRDGFIQKLTPAKHGLRLFSITDTH